MKLWSASITAAKLYHRPGTTRPAAEARVTFVRRHAQAAAAKSPADAGRDPQATGAADGFVPAVAGAEEAEVTIIKPEDPATAPVRRFLKALSGD